MKWLSYVLGAVAVVALVFAIRHFAAAPAPIVVKLEPGPPMPRVSPAEGGIDPVALEQAVEYAGARGTKALIVGRGLHVVYEKYWGGTTADSAVELSGFAPALAALAVGTAANDRLVVLDVPVANYLPGDESGATIRQLLSRQRPAEIEADVDVLARLLEKVTGQRYEALVADRLWRPLGAGDFAFAPGEGSRAGLARAGCCFRARIGDWMRVGELLAHDGVFEGNQFTPPRFVTSMLSPAYKTSPAGWFTRVDGTFAARNVARLESAGAQRLWVVPSLQLFILRVGDDPGAKGWDEVMIPDTIIRGTSGWEPAAAGEGVDPKKYAPH